MPLKRTVKSEPTTSKKSTITRLVSSYCELRKPSLYARTLELSCEYVTELGQVMLYHKSSSASFAIRSAFQLDETPTRSQTIARDIVCALCGHGYAQLRMVRFRLDGGHVVLSGRVRSFYMKQVAQTVVMKVPGVVQLCNEMVVIDE
jgi:hypothetical protein